VQLAVVVEQPVQRLQNLRLRQVELVEHDPVAVPHCRGERAVAED